LFGNNDIDLLKIKTKCDICKRTFLRLELHLTAIPGFGCEMCDECFEKFIEKVIKPGTPRDRNIQMKIDPSSYEEAMKSLKIPSDDWITNQLSGEGRWWDITMLVNKERYVNFIENADVLYEDFDNKYELHFSSRECPHCGYEKRVVRYISVPCSDHWIWERNEEYCARCFRKIPLFSLRSDNKNKLSK